MYNLAEKKITGKRFFIKPKIKKLNAKPIIKKIMKLKKPSKSEYLLIKKYGSDKSNTIYNIPNNNIMPL